jgi:hypothetical protein
VSRERVIPQGGITLEFCFAKSRCGKAMDGYRQKHENIVSGSEILRKAGQEQAGSFTFPSVKIPLNVS